MVILNKSNKIFTLFILFLFVGTTSSLLINVEAASGSVTYTGYVRDTSSNPISGAYVRLTINNDDLSTVYNDDTTSSSGYFSVTTSYTAATPPVEISLSVSVTNYASDYYGATVPDGSYSHNFNLVYTGPPPPTVGWVSPTNNEIITFTPSNNLFNFTYSAGDIDYTRLYMGPAGSSPTIQFGTDWSNEGSFIDKTVDIGVHMGDLHGMVRADLRSYISSSVVVSSTRTFNFSKQILIERELIEDGRDDLGSNLLLILYDPPGDNSYSSWTSESEITIHNTLNIDFGVSATGEIGVDSFLATASSKVEIDLTGGIERSWGCKITDIAGLTSSLNSAERDLVGPGYGDLYYGEWQVFVWELFANKITYSDSEVVYGDLNYYFGMEYSDNVLVSHQHAPEAWKQQNPHINATLMADSNIIDWSENDSIIQGGTGLRSGTHEYADTYGLGASFSFSVSETTKAKCALAGTEVEVHFTSKYEGGFDAVDNIKTSFQIYDDDSVDLFHYDIGTDRRFGVPIFRNFPTDNHLFQSYSSTPWEHNTRDVLSPETTYPVVTLNTDGDGYSPSEGDTPLVELTITDESNITVASLLYSHDAGAHWNLVGMTERLGDPDSWYANLPSHEHGSEVLWYIFTIDSNNNSKTVLNIDNETFSYTVVNRPCTVTLTSPNGGGTYNDSILIEWSGSDLDDDSLTYNIGYRTTGGSWTQIAAGLTNTSYLWDISHIADSDTVSVIVYANDGYGSTDDDDSNFVFSIDNEDIPEATITAPLASFTYQGILTIIWSVDDPDDFVTGFGLYYSITSGSPTWVLIDDAIAAGLLTFEWNTNSSVVYSTDARLMIVVENSLAETVNATSGIFTIDNRPTMAMNLINPNGGEIIAESCSVSWNLALGNPVIIYQIKLEYSVNGSDWILIDSGLTGTTYEWNTTALLSGPNYRVRITLTASFLGYELDSIIDISETAFIILHSTDLPTNLGAIPIFIAVISLVSVAIVPLVKAKKHNKK